MVIFHCHVSFRGGMFDYILNTGCRYSIYLKLGFGVEVILFRGDKLCYTVVHGSSKLYFDVPLAILGTVSQDGTNTGTDLYVRNLRLIFCINAYACTHTHSAHHHTTAYVKTHISI